MNEGRFVKCVQVLSTAHCELRSMLQVDDFCRQMDGSWKGPRGGACTQPSCTDGEMKPSPQGGMGLAKVPGHVLAERESALRSPGSGSQILSTSPESFALLGQWREPPLFNKHTSASEKSGEGPLFSLYLLSSTRLPPNRLQLLPQPEGPAVFTGVGMETLIHQAATLDSVVLPASGFLNSAPHRGHLVFVT